MIHGLDSGSGRLGPAERSTAVAELRSLSDGPAGTRALDVVIVGGGVVGAGAALDAATRGLSVAVFDARDWASGTSSRSSKLVHGGLRYLEMLDFGLVREALQERGLILSRLAPHLVRPVPFLYPLKHRGGGRRTAASGGGSSAVMAPGPGRPPGLPLPNPPTPRHPPRPRPAPGAGGSTT